MSDQLITMVLAIAASGKTVRLFADHGLCHLTYADNRYTITTPYDCTYKSRDGMALYLRAVPCFGFVTG